jgi:hypothetical protein
MLVYKFGGATTRTVRGLDRMADLIETAHADELRKLKRKRSSGVTYRLVCMSVPSINFMR